VISQSFPNLGQQNPAKPSGLLLSAAPAPKFAASSIIPLPIAAMAGLQFPLIGEALTAQSQRIYAVMIGGRVAESREPVEAREHATRDILGSSSWFWGIPIIQRLFLRSFAPQDIQKALLLSRPAPRPLPVNTGTLKVFGRQLQQLDYHVLHNPLARYNLVSLQELANRKRDLERIWERTHAHLSTEAKAELEKPALRYLTRLTHWRKSAMGIGLTITLLTMGVGINLLNIWMTKNQIKREEQKKLSLSG